MGRDYFALWVALMEVRAFISRAPLGKATQRTRGHNGLVNHVNPTEYEINVDRNYFRLWPILNK